MAAQTEVVCVMQLSVIYESCGTLSWVYRHIIAFAPHWGEALFMMRRSSNCWPSGCLRGLLKKLKVGQYPIRWSCTVHMKIEVSEAVKDRLGRSCWGRSGTTHP